MDCLHIRFAITMYLGVKKIHINQNKIFTPRLCGGFLWAALGAAKGKSIRPRVIYFWAGKFYFGIIHFYKRGFLYMKKLFILFLWVSAFLMFTRRKIPAK